MHARWRSGVVVLALVALVASGCDYIVRANVAPDGSEVAEGGDNPSLSADGRYVAFGSFSSGLVAGQDENEAYDVFVRDLRTGITKRASVDSAGGDTNQGSIFPSISADGRYVAFDSLASDLVAGDSGEDFDVFVRDLQAGTTTRASVDTGGGDANGDSTLASISPDGQHVAFISEASDLVPGDGTGGSGASDVFVRNLQTGTTTRVSVDTAGGDPNDLSRWPSISTGGRYVAFESFASDLVPDDGTAGDAGRDVFVRDMQTGVTTRASVDTAGGDTDGSTFAPDITPDGRLITFTSEANDIVANLAANHRRRVFVRNLRTGRTTRVSVDINGGSPNLDAGLQPKISADGRYVVFDSNASDLVPGDTNMSPDVFVRDRRSGTTSRQSVDALRREVQGQDGPFNVAISGDGRYVAFDSQAFNLVPNDGNDRADVFVRSNPLPTVDSVTPASIERGTSSNLTVVGSGFLPGARVSLGSAVTVTSVTVVSATELTVAVTVATDAATGDRSVTVSNPGTGPGDSATSTGTCSGCVTIT